MAKKKSQRAPKQQMGQFMTPQHLAHAVLDNTNQKLTTDTKIFEPSLGKGVFIFEVIDKLLSETYSSLPTSEALPIILETNLYGLELDAELYSEFHKSFQERFGKPLSNFNHNFHNIDFFDYEPEVNFDLIIGNPPFGGTFNPSVEDALDKKLGKRLGYKIKKETYAFFTVACIEMLSEKGELAFILSDTFLTINTMQGLRRYASSCGAITVNALSEFSDETDYGMVIIFLDKSRGNAVDSISINGEEVSLDTIKQTPNFSWGITKELSQYFSGQFIGDYMLASSGMTIGKNELFLREIGKDNTIVEAYDFKFSNEPITLTGEISRARLNRISDETRKRISEKEARGDTRKILTWTTKKVPETITLPNKDYRYYNKAQPHSFYAAPASVVYWKDDGEAVYTFKKQGPWYLHGVGGKSFFKKEGITWNLISSTIKARFLPEGYILDSGAPLAILRENVNQDELWFILGWLNTDAATEIMKTVINHTKNIQSKDMERLPYPLWTSPKDKVKIIAIVKRLVTGLQGGNTKASDIAIAKEKLEKLFNKKA